MSNWETEMVDILQIMLGDYDGTAYSDETLKRVLVVAAQMVASELDFSQDFESDFDNMDITPDPTEEATRDVSFINLTCIKAACIINRGEAWKSAGKSFKVKDIGGIAIDKSDAFKNKFALLEKGGWCAVYSEEKLEYQLNNNVVAGQAILSPFRTSSGWASYEV